MPQTRRAYIFAAVRRNDEIDKNPISKLPLSAGIGQLPRPDTHRGAQQHRHLGAHGRPGRAAVQHTVPHTHAAPAPHAPPAGGPPHPPPAPANPPAPSPPAPPPATVTRAPYPA